MAFVQPLSSLSSLRPSRTSLSSCAPPSPSSTSYCCAPSSFTKPSSSYSPPLSVSSSFSSFILSSSSSQPYSSAHHTCWLGSSYRAVPRDDYYVRFCPDTTTPPAAPTPGSTLIMSQSSSSSSSSSSSPSPSSHSPAAAASPSAKVDSSSSSSPAATSPPPPLTTANQQQHHPPAPSPPPPDISNNKAIFDPEGLVRPELLHMAPYSPILPYEVLAERLGRAVDDIVKLDANENPYGPAPSVARALAAAPFLHIYPDPESTALRQAIASYTSVAPEYILVGAGADELIDLLFRLFIAPGNNSVVANGNGGGINGQTAQQKEQLLQQQSIVNCPPTFGMYRFDADVNGAVVHDVYRRADDFSIDIDAIEALFARLTADGLPPPKMVFVTSPNNPDGSVVSDAVLTRLLRLPTLVVLDEAYFEFSRENRITWVPHVSNLVVLRTFSKWAGLAGMRIGYGAFPLNIIKHLWKIKQPYNVSVAAQIAAIASIEEKHDLLAKVEALVIQRERFYERIKNVSWLTPFPSSSNYVLCRVHGGRSAVEVKEQLAKRGILIRYYTSTGLADCIRISMGTDEQMERVYKALAEL